LLGESCGPQACGQFERKCLTGLMRPDGDKVPCDWTQSSKLPMAIVPASSPLECPSIDASSRMSAAPKFSFGSKPNRASKDDKSVAVPGPGSYFESFSEQVCGRKTVPKFSFGAATRKELRTARVPGPGSYVASSTMGDGNAFSCTPRRIENPDKKWDREKTTPGPGSHMIPRDLGGSGRGPKITPRRNPDQIAEQMQKLNPGPGQYEPGSEAALAKQAKPPQWGFGSAPARPRLDSSVCPGPGAYRHEAHLNGKGPKYSIRARTANAKVGMLQEL